MLQLYYCTLYIIKDKLIEAMHLQLGNTTMYIAWSRKTWLCVCVCARTCDTLNKFYFAFKAHVQDFVKTLEEYCIDQSFKRLKPAMVQQV